MRKKMKKKTEDAIGEIENTKLRFFRFVYG